MAHVPIVRKYDSSIGKCENASQWRTQWRTQCRIISEIVDTSGKYVLCFLVVIILDMVSLTCATCIYYHIFKWFEQIILGTGNRGIFWIFWIFHILCGIFIPVLCSIFVRYNMDGGELPTNRQ